MSRGPKRTPKDILALRGSRHATRKTEPALKSSRPSVPTNFLKNKRALTLWHALVERVEKTGQLVEIDDLQLARYVELTILKENCIASIQKADPADGKTMTPLMNALDRFCRALERMERNFYLQPDARSRMPAPPTPPAKDNQFARAR